jgi:hypothetical protein
MLSKRKYIGIFAVMVMASSFVSAQVVNVSPVPGNPAASGANLLSALAGIVDATSAKPYVLRLDPGIYDVGSTALAMKPYVDIEGSGQQSTIIRGPGNNAGFLTAVVLGANNAELRDLQVNCYGKGYDYAIAVLLNQTSTSLRDVTLVASSATANWGLRNLSANSTAQNVTINVSGGSSAYGIANTGGTAASPVIRRAVINVARASTAYGIYNDQYASPKIRDVEISASGVSAYGIEYGYTFDMAGATLEVINAKINAISSTGAAVGIDLNGNDTVAVSHSNIVASSTSSSSYGLKISYGTFTSTFLVDHCDVTGATNSVSAPIQTVRAGASKLDGPVSIGVPSCVASFNGSYAPLNASCL